MAMAEPPGPPSAPPASIDYARDIKPLLRDRCLACHGPVAQKGDLRLDAGPLFVADGDKRNIVVPGRPDDSELLRRVRAQDHSERMPPEGSPLSAEQVDRLTRWVEAGAKFPEDESVARTPAEHWAFQPVRRPALPVVVRTDWPRNPIDVFVLARLEREGIDPAPEATRAALVRRVAFDLVGLPPSPEEHARLVALEHEAVVDELLAHPGFGERWARHWLDVVRYADSNGYERDAEKPFVWRYRDYVIRSFNDDVPFDRFVTEQIAGDELPDANARTMIATGFLRLGHWDDEPADLDTDRYDQLDDIVSTVGQAFLGLTIGCARCHDHKFEPLTAKDYYSLVSVFAPLSRPRNGRTDLSTPVGTREELSRQAMRDSAISDIRREIAEARISKDAGEAKIATLRAETPDLPEAYIWRETSPVPSETHVLLRGSPGRLGDLVHPAFPAVLATHGTSEQPFVWPQPDERTTRRRTGLARWLVSPDNPLTARVIVNRVWQQHFGRGLVDTANDFGLMGSPPADQELLDWLADWFVRDARWSLKRLHRLIVTSATWRQAKAPASGGAAERSAALRWNGRRRLEVEALRDAMLVVGGRFNPQAFGPAMKPPIPAAVIEANSDKNKAWTPSPPDQVSRRTVYAYVKRGMLLPMLESLDLPDTVTSCAKRQITTVAPQALSLFNGDFTLEQSRNLADRLVRELGPDASPEARVERAWQIALNRPPTPTELAATRRFLADEPLFQLCRVLLNLNEFAYPE
jgi:mono/diheme cytochrome c family protein